MYCFLCANGEKHGDEPTLKNKTLKVRDVLTHYSNFSLLSAEYNGRPTCAAYSGTSNSGSPNIQIVLDG